MSIGLSITCDWKIERKIKENSGRDQSIGGRRERNKGTEEGEGGGGEKEDAMTPSVSGRVTHGHSTEGRRGIPGGKEEERERERKTERCYRLVLLYLMG